MRVLSVTFALPKCNSYTNVIPGVAGEHREVITNLHPDIVTETEQRGRIAAEDVACPSGRMQKLTALIFDRASHEVECGDASREAIGERCGSSRRDTPARGRRRYPFAAPRRGREDHPRARPRRHRARR